MKRLGISVEGATEREFVHQVLRPHLEKYQIFVTAIDIEGNVSLDKIRRALPPLLGAFDFVSTFYDFYGFKARNGCNVEELEAEIGKLFSNSRLISYVQQYEFEALIFAVPESAVEWLEGRTQQREEMQNAVQKAGSPEKVNDRFETSPSHRLKKLFPRYDKKLHGSEIIDLAGLKAVRSKCSRFDNWVSKLESLGSKQ
jgi:hypothetical protein